MKIPQQIYNNLKVYDSKELDKLINAVADELNTRSYYGDSEIEFIYTRDVE